MRVVAALGGNALLRRGESAEAEVQRDNVARATRSLAELASEHELIVTHGNGPQVGLLALQAESFTDVRPYPLDILGAESEGMIGYLLDQGLSSELPDRHVATLLTQVVVDRHDPALREPTKPIGPWHDEVTAALLARDHGWRFITEGGACRRVVASPEPKRIVEIDTIRLLVDAGVVVVCAGGGGIPVTVTALGGLRGVEAVIDKDLSAALLAEQIEADALLLLTDVDAIHTGWGTYDDARLRTASPKQLRELDLPAGSMRPKAEAAARFVERTGGRAAIAALEDAALALTGAAGTSVNAAGKAHLAYDQRAVGARP
jgi:carbamate kinase